ncbi:hypothetical protein HY993_01590 [Candidatus Micrarchaeota archaeon]|nr:hypothetical protein [Candidatus Micrarchaeota archaeon]
MATAVLATLPFSEGLTVAKFPIELSFFQDLVLVMIFLTNLITAIGIF